MPVYHPRTRLVNFRLSEEEFELLQQTCSRSGARSISDFARAAVLSAPSIPPTSLGCGTRLDRLESLLTRLENSLAQRPEGIAHHG